MPKIQRREISSLSKRNGKDDDTTMRTAPPTPSSHLPRRSDIDATPAVSVDVAPHPTAATPTPPSPTPFPPYLLLLGWCIIATKVGAILEKGLGKGQEWMAPACTNIRWHHGCVERKERQSLLNQKGCVVWITGLSGSGKSTVACAIDHALARMGKLCYVLDGDNVRHGLCKDLGFSVEDREENIRRVGEVAKLMADAGLVTLVSCISPYKRNREFVRGLMNKGEFIEVYMKVPLSICEKRDCKGLYKLARAGVIKGFTGIDDPYEVSEKPEVTLEATNAARELITPDCMAETVIDYLVVNGLLSGPCF